MEDVGEAMLEETPVPVEVEAETEAMVDVVEVPVEETATMQRPAALLKPIRGTLRPLEEEEEVRTATLTPVGHMLIPEKKRGPPPSSSVGKPTTTSLRPVRGTLTPVTKSPVKRLEPEDDHDEN